MSQYISTHCYCIWVLCPPILSRRVLEISIKLGTGCSIGGLALILDDLHALLFEGTFALCSKEVGGVFEGLRSSDYECQYDAPLQEFGLYAVQ